ncbi:hypothetical protein YC2023_065306 [Brassica napus]
MAFGTTRPALARPAAVSLSGGSLREMESSSGSSRKERSSSGGGKKMERSSDGGLSRGEEESVGGAAPLVLVGGIVL